MNMKKFDSPLDLKILDQNHQFCSIGDFTFALDGRYSISTNKLEELIQHSATDLDAELKKIADVNQTLFSIVSEMIEDPTCVVKNFRDLEPTLFTQEQSWRSIILSLFECDEIYNSLRIVSLTKYMQYLSSLDDTIKLIKAQKESIDGMTGNEQNVVDFGATWGPGQILLDQEPSFGSSNNFKKLPKDRPIEINLPAGKRMDFRLASHKCQLISANNIFQFVDKDRILSLKKGSYVVGRSNKSAIQIDPTVKDVSRSHLTIEVSDKNVLFLTDTSTAGSYIPLEYLNRA